MLKLNNIFVFLAVIVFCMGCAQGGQSTNGLDKSYPYTVDSKNDTIYTEKGEIIISKRLQLDEAIIPSGKEEYKKVEGNIENNTDLYFSSLDLSLNFKRGGINENSESVFILDVPPGNSNFDRRLVTFDFYREGNDVVEFDIDEAEALYNYEISMIDSDISSGSSFSDESIDLSFSLDPSDVSFRLKNKTDKQIKIMWNQVSFVNTSGTSNKVIHKGVKYSNAGSSMPPTSVPPNSSVNETVHPVNKISYSETSNEWKKEPILPVSVELSELQQGNFPESMTGSTFSIYMPMEIGGNEEAYTFKFRVDDVMPVRSPR